MNILVGTQCAIFLISGFLTNPVDGFAAFRPIAIVGKVPRDASAFSLASTESDQELELFQQRQVLKMSLLFKAQDTKRGFTATSNERKEIAQLISQLSDLNPTEEPAADYYENNEMNWNTEGKDRPSLSGKWTLAYTNAPDITSLDPSTSSSLLPPPPPSAKLGRIGQECDATKRTISNVIEWKQPDWLGNILNSDGEGSRVLQKVVCEAKSSPDKPFEVDLQLVGFELQGQTSDESDQKSGTSSSFPDFSSLLNQGPAAILSKNPISLRGPLKAPFGKFEIQYLDDEMRIIKTGQGYYAVNIREGQTWF